MRSPFSRRHVTLYAPGPLFGKCLLQRTLLPKPGPVSRIVKVLQDLLPSGPLTQSRNFSKYSAASEMLSLRTPSILRVLRHTSPDSLQKRVGLWLAPEGGINTQKSATVVVATIALRRIGIWRLPFWPAGPRLDHGTHRTLMDSCGPPRPNRAVPRRDRPAR